MIMRTNLVHYHHTRVLGVPVCLVGNVISICESHFGKSTNPLSSFGSYHSIHIMFCHLLMLVIHSFKSHLIKNRQCGQIEDS